MYLHIPFYVTLLSIAFNGQVQAASLGDRIPIIEPARRDTLPRGHIHRSILDKVPAIALKGSPLEKKAQAITLDPNAIQTGSAQVGDPNPADPGQENSATSNENFINFCSGLTLTNGLQNTDGSCNGIVMGKIPAKTNMISSILVFPTAAEAVEADTTFNISVQVSNLVAGSFTNAASTYYSAPQDLDAATGNIIGHTHVTVQDMGNTLTPTTPLDPTTFVFFKGINDAGNGEGLLQATVTGGLPAGNYRVCSMTSASNHQPVLMPIAQRGAQDDCTKFVVKAGAGSSSSSSTTTTAAKVASTASSSSGSKSGFGSKSGSGAKANSGSGSGSASSGGSSSGDTDSETESACLAPVTTTSMITVTASASTITAVASPSVDASSNSTAKFVAERYRHRARAFIV